MLIDTHTHLESFARAGTLAATLARARAAGVGEMITIGTSPEDWPLYHDLSAANPGFVHYTVGIHPCAVDSGWQKSMASLEGYWNGPGKPVALGEIGLDRFHLPKGPPEAEALFGI